MTLKCQVQGCLLGLWKQVYGYNVWWYESHQYPPFSNQLFLVWICGWVIAFTILTDLFGLFAMTFLKCFFQCYFFCEHSLFAPPSNLQIFWVFCFCFEILLFFCCGFIVILSRPHDVETICICYQWGIIVVWSYLCFSKGFQARS